MENKSGVFLSIIAAILFTGAAILTTSLFKKETPKTQKETMNVIATSAPEQPTNFISAKKEAEITGGSEAEKVINPLIVHSASTWYGGPNDAEDNDIPACPGTTNKNPGVAIRPQKDDLSFESSIKTKCGWWRITYHLPEGDRIVVVQQSDVGPGAQRLQVDTNYTLVRQLGYQDCVTGNNCWPEPMTDAVYLGKRTN